MSEPETMQITRAFLHLLALLAGSMLCVSASATVFDWTATLDQAQEVPAPSAVAGARGSATGTVDDSAGILSWRIEFEGLSGTAIGLHFHGPAGPGSTASVQVNITSLTGSNTSPAVGSLQIEPDSVTALLDGNWYVNVHTELNMGGEIRGQVVLAPSQAASEPGTALLLILGVGLLLLGRFRSGGTRREPPHPES